jgi:hypothetical protein
VAIQESASTSAAAAASISAAAAATAGSLVKAPDTNPISQQTVSRTRKTKAREESLREEEEAAVGQELRGKGSEKQNQSGVDDVSGGSPSVSVAKRKRPRLSAAVTLESQRNKTLEASLLAALLPQHQSSSKDRK